MNSRLLLRLAVRETRGASRHAAFFAACIALGVGALTGVTGFGSAVERTIRREARALLGADVQIETKRPLSAQAEGVLKRLEARGAATARVLEMASMASSSRDGAAQLVELKAVGPGYPFYGRVVTEPEGAFAALAERGNLVAEESLLVRLDRRVGDRVRIGRSEFRIAGVLRKEPDRVAGAFSLGPRVLVWAADAEAAGLVRSGSRIRWRTLLKLAPELRAEEVDESLARELKGERAEVTTYAEAQPWLRRFLVQLTSYLSLLALMALFLGGIGVGMSVHAFLREKLPTLAVLKCLGFDSRTLIAGYLLQTMLIALAGGAAGVALGTMVQAALPAFLRGMVPEGLPRLPGFVSAFNGVGMGLGVALLFSTWPLLSIRTVRPLRILRRDVEESEGGPAAPRPWAVAGALAAGLSALALWQAGSLRDGGIFLGALAGALGALGAGAWGLLKAMRRVRGGHPMVRHGLANLHRPGSRSATVLVAVGLGTAVTLAAHLVEHSLLARVTENMPKDAPDFFFVDIQPDQKRGFEAESARFGVKPTLQSVARSRLESVKGVAVAEMDLEGRRDRWYFEREYVLTFADRLPPGNAVVRGRWSPESGTPWVSVEEDAAKHLGLDLGDAVEMDVQGTPLKARVTSIRSVNWGNFSTNFYMIFSPGSMKEVAYAWLATAQVPSGSSFGLQRALAKTFPNVTAIQLRAVLDTVGSVLGRLAAAIRFMGAFAVAAGIFVLAGAVASTRFRRLRESALLKTLGATRGQAAAALAVEYAVLGSAAGLLGAATAAALAWVVCRWVMKLPLVLEWEALAGAWALAAAGTVATGFLSTYGVLCRKPLEVLRSE